MFSLGSSSEGSLKLSVEPFNGAVGLWVVAGSSVAAAENKDISMLHTVDSK